MTVSTIGPAVTPPGAAGAAATSTSTYAPNGLPYWTATTAVVQGERRVFRTDGNTYSSKSGRTTGASEAADLASWDLVTGATVATPSSPSSSSLPDQAGNAGKYLKTDGTTASWGVTGATVGLLAARPAASGSSALYFATNVGTNGTLYVDAAAGTWRVALSSLLDDPIYSTHNVTPASLRYSRGALAACRLGTRDFRFLVEGDSIGGATIGTATPQTDNIGRRAAQILAQKTGLSARQGMIPLYAWNSTTVAQAQWTIGAGWSNNAIAKFTDAHQGATAPAGTATPLDFTPTDDSGAAIQTDSFIIYAYAGGSAGNLQWSIDGGGYTALTTTATLGQGINAYTVSAGARGFHTLHIKAAAAGGDAYVLGAEAVDSTTRGIRWVCGGTGGSVTPSAFPNNDLFVKSYAPDLVVWQWNVNEYNNQQSLSSFLANATLYGALPAAFAKPADCLWLTSIPLSVAKTIPQQSYYDTLDAAAEAAGFGVLHIDRQLTTYAAAAAAPLALGFGDGIHPSAAGYAFIGNTLAALLGTL